jgi:hypothetical protein
MRETGVEILAPASAACNAPRMLPYPGLYLRDWTDDTALELLYPEVVVAEAIRATPEMSSAFLCAFFRYRTEDNREQCRIYQQLVESLKDDKKILVMAAAQGQKAADYILNKQEDQIELDDAA